MKLKHLISFYADTPKGEKNKHFTFKVTYSQRYSAVYKFIEKGFKIRACWYVLKDDSGHVLRNERLLFNH
jgi:hypothetical protein